MIEFQKHLAPFKKTITDTWLTPRGIWFSEGFALTSAINELGINLVLESGTAYGGSAEMMAQMCSKVPILTMDHFEYYKDAEEFSKKRLSKYSNVKIVKGDSTVLMKDILLNTRHDKVAIFVDGPKGTTAFNLVMDILNNFAHRIALVGVHDVKSHTKIASFYRKAFANKEVLFTDEKYGFFAPFREEIDLHMLNLNKKNHKPTESSLSRTKGAGYLQTQFDETPNGFGLLLAKGPFA